MPLAQGDLAYCAARLHQAAVSLEPIRPLSERFDSLDTQDAYAIQARLLALHDRPAAGFKLGFTSAAMRAQMGVDEPNYGLLLRGGQRTDTAPIADFIHPLIEPEIALVLASPLAGPDATAESAADAVESCHVAMEIVDSRYLDYRFEAADNIADNSSAAGYVLGPGHPLPAAGRLPDIAAVIEKNGEVLDRGAARAALGGPAQALAWLANVLAATGEAVPAGAVVLTGGLTRAYPAGAGDRFLVTADGLGEVSLQFV